MSAPAVLSSSVAAVVSEPLSNVANRTTIVTQISVSSSATSRVLCVGDLGDLAQPPPPLPETPACAPNAWKVELRRADGSVSDRLDDTHTHAQTDTYSTLFVTGNLTTSHYEVVAQLGGPCQSTPRMQGVVANAGTSYTCRSASHHEVQHDSTLSLATDAWSTRITGRLPGGPPLLDVTINATVSPELDDAVPRAFEDARRTLVAAVGPSVVVRGPTLLSSSAQPATQTYLPGAVRLTQVTYRLSTNSFVGPWSICIGDYGDLAQPPASFPTPPCPALAPALNLIPAYRSLGTSFYDTVVSTHVHTQRDVYAGLYVTGTLTTSHYDFVAEGTGTASNLTVTRVVPIVLDVTTDTARYTTELTLTNDTPDAVTVSALYTPALGSKSGKGTVTDSLGPGEQRRIPDVLSWLQMKGLPLPPVEVEASQGGTLKLDFTGPSAQPARVWALARTGSDTRSPQPVGRSGVAYAAPLASEGASFQRVGGLRSNATDRSNVAVVNLSHQPVSFQMHIQSLTGFYVDFPVRGGTLTLPPWGWMQINSAELLDANGIRDGYASVFGPDGSRLYLYGVINDRETNDGSFLAPVDGCTASSTTRTEAFPAVEMSGFTTELTLFNSWDRGMGFQLDYVESASPGMGAGGIARFGFDQFTQTIYPNLFNYLRDEHVSVGPIGAANYAGVLSVTSFGLGTGKAMERVLSPSPAGGAFGVALPGACLTDAATDRAAIYGLVSNDTNRSNVAIFSTGGSVTLRLDVHDGLAGGVVRGVPVTVSLGPTEWKQVNDILRRAGVTEGWVEITRESAAGSWFAYGVVNDGAYPGQRSGDGSFVAASIPRP